MINVPIFLSLIRIIGAITILPLLLTYKNIELHWYIKIFSALIFLLLASTDFFDGYYARKYACETKIGALLDPIADKFLLTSTILCLAWTKQIHLIFALPMILREISILSLRQYAAENQQQLPVSKNGKFKTALQFFTLFFTICAQGHSGIICNIKNILLTYSTYMSLFSLYDYILKIFI